MKGTSPSQGRSGRANRHYATLSRSVQQPKGTKLNAMSDIVVDIGVSGLYEIFDEANYFFQFVTLD